MIGRFEFLYEYTSSPIYIYIYIERGGFGRPGMALAYPPNRPIKNLGTKKNNNNKNTNTNGLCHPITF
jgi:hypothetical protein